MSKTILDCDPHLAEIVELMPRCHSTSSMRETALPAICEYFSANSAVLHYYAGSEGFGHFYDPIYTNIDPSFIDNFRTQFSQLDPFPKGALNNFISGNGYAYINQQIINEDEYLNSKFYIEFLKPQNIHHMLIIVVTRGNKPFAFLGIHRNKQLNAFTKEDTENANILGPFLSAMADRVHLADERTLYQRVIDTLSYGLMNKGVIVVDQNVALVYANEYASIALSKRDDFDLANRIYPHAILEACEVLSQKRSQADAPSNVNFTLEGDGPKLAGYVRISEGIDNQSLYLAFFNSEEFGVLNPKVCEKYGFTTREIEIIRCVIEGKTNTEISDELFISVRTVQNHLRSIFAKSDVHNRTSLSNKVLSLN